MRKRLVIGAIGAVVIGVAAYVLSQPRKGTVEYHRAQYSVLIREAEDKTLHARSVRLMNGVFGTKFRSRSDRFELARRMEVEQENLLRLGYLVETNYCFTNIALDTDARWIRDGVYDFISREEAWLSSFGRAEGNSNVLVVTAPRRVIPIWERFIAEVDRPAKK
jgi:hypothetical protein